MRVNGIVYVVEVRKQCFVQLFLLESHSYRLRKAEALNTFFVQLSVKL